MNVYNWSQIIADIVFKLGLNQKGIGDMIGVTQQTISNWGSGIRTPSVRARRKMIQIATDCDLDIESYRLDVGEIGVSRKPCFELDAALIDRRLKLVLEKFDRLRVSQRRLVMDMMDVVIDHQLQER